MMTLDNKLPPANEGLNTAIRVEGQEVLIQAANLTQSKTLTPALAT